LLVGIVRDILFLLIHNFVPANAINREKEQEMTVSASVICLYTCDDRTHLLGII
jgi:hypothetical protein